MWTNMSQQLFAAVNRRSYRGSLDSVSHWPARHIETRRRNLLLYDLLSLSPWICTGFYCCCFYKEFKNEHIFAHLWATKAKHSFQNVLTNKATLAFMQRRWWDETNYIKYYIMTRYWCYFSICISHLKLPLNCGGKLHTSYILDYITAIAIHFWLNYFVSKFTYMHTQTHTHIHMHIHTECHHNQ